MEIILESEDELESLPADTQALACVIRTLNGKTLKNRSGKPLVASVDLKELQAKSWRISEEHGFHDAMLNLPPKTLATYLKMLLIIGEVIEATEELRDGHEFTEVYYEYKDGAIPCARGAVTNSSPWAVVSETGVGFYDSPPSNIEHHEWVVPGKPCGIPIELADAQIRLADLCEDIGVDLSEAVHMKEAYNEQREFMHGKTA